MFIRLIPSHNSPVYPGGHKHLYPNMVVDDTEILVHVPPFWHIYLESGHFWVIPPLKLDISKQLGIFQGFNRKNKSFSFKLNGYYLKCLYVKTIASIFCLLFQ